MKDLITAVAQILALENSAQLAVTAGVACDVTNPWLVRMETELNERLESIGIDLLALHLDGETLVARIDESLAGEPLCPFAFQGVVRNLSYQLLGRALDARIEDATPVAPELSPVA